MEVYSPSITSAAAEYLATITSRTTGGDLQYGRGSRQRLVNLDVPEVAIAAIEKGRTVPTIDRMVGPARRHRPRAQCDRGHARPAGRRPVQDRRPFRHVGSDRHRRARSRFDRQGAAGHRPGAELPGREFAGKVEVIYPDDQQGNPDGARSRRTAKSRPDPAARHVRRRRDRYRKRRAGRWPFPKARCSTAAPGRRCWSTRARAGSSRATSSSAIAAAVMSKSATA